MFVKKVKIWWYVDGIYLRMEKQQLKEEPWKQCMGQMWATHMGYHRKDPRCVPDMNAHIKFLRYIMQTPIEF